VCVFWEREKEKKIEDREILCVCEREKEEKMGDRDIVCVFMRERGEERVEK